MPAFRPPEFLAFKNNVALLYDSYSLACGRYRPYKLLQGETSISEQQTFDRLVERISRITTTSKSKREGELEVFSSLVEELKLFVSSTKAKSPIEHKKAINTSIYILLGALIHRRLRLERGGVNEYLVAGEVNAVLVSLKRWGVPMFFPTSQPENSNLYQEIGEALLLNKENPLDNVTIVKALQLFKSNMLNTVQVPGKGEQARYTTYKHFKTDTFLPNLDILIEEHKLKAEPSLTQFAAINFIRSLADLLDKDQEFFRKEFVELCQDWEKAHKNNLLKIKDTANFVETYCKNKNKHQRLREEFLYFLKTEKMGSSNDTELKYEDFKQKMEEANSEWRSVILYGGCVLLLKKGNLQASSLSERLERKLAASVIDCLKTGKSDDTGNKVELNIEDLGLAISFFQEYINHRLICDPTSPGRCIVENLSELDCEYFGDFQRMMDEVSILGKVLDGLASKEHQTFAADRVLGLPSSW